MLTWLVGMGRYWDNPRALPLQHAGVGSLAYVVVLTVLLWLIGAPLRPVRWSLRNLFTFVTLTSAPGLLYALPVERWLAPDAARTTNLCFLAVVAAWRVVLYARYLGGYAQFAPGPRAVQLLLPLTLIVSALAALNLERAVFDVMGGIRETTPADSAYLLVLGLSFVSVCAFPILLTAWLILIVRAWRRHRRPGDLTNP